MFKKVLAYEYFVEYVYDGNSQIFPTDVPINGI